MRAKAWRLIAFLSIAPPTHAAPFPAHENPAACRSASFEDDSFNVCRYVPGADDIMLAWRGKDGPLGSLAGLRSWLGFDASRVEFAMNAGMYDQAQSPVGLFVVSAQQLHSLNRAIGPGNFFIQPNGVFRIDERGGPHVDDTATFAGRDVHPRWATQSGPLLIKAGVLNANIAPNGASLTIRNGVGVRAGEAMFVISNKPVSFGRFARFMRDQLQCPDVLYFDGAISSLWTPASGRMDDRTGLGTFVVVLKAARR